ncbi:MAG: hypothetical protein K5917_04465 [Clostridiales bacterium]|nr:hypothetical protein [Clostridiales bacterium]
MKKCTLILLAFILIFILVGCESTTSSSRTGNQSASVNDILQASATQEDNKKSETTTNSSQSNSIVNKEYNTSSSNNNNNQNNIDVDLTAMSSTMVYSEVYSMLVTPDRYLGKTVKMKGKFVVYHDEPTDKYYFACVISDATACCSQGMEFILAGEHNYPNDYPKQGEEITVVGVFGKYNEGSKVYCTLKDAEIL